MIKYRSNFGITLDILKVLQNEAGDVKISILSRRSNISHERLIEKLIPLLNGGLVKRSEMVKHRKLNGEPKKKYVFYSLTKDGLEFLFKARNIEELAKSIGLDVHN